MYCKLLKESVARLKGDEISLRPTATTCLDFLQNIDGESDLRREKLHYMESYILETRLRIDAYRKVASACTEKEVDALEDEMQDRFGPS